MHGLLIEDSKLNFSSSHFIAEHNKCERLHGHNYRIKIELEGKLNEKFMVMDFKDAKDRVSAICDVLDHKILLPAHSPSLKIQEKRAQIEVKSAEKFYSFPKEDCVLLPIKATTAEELAGYVFKVMEKDIPTLSKVYVAESEGSAAYYSEE